MLLPFSEIEALLEKYSLPVARFFTSKDCDALVQQSQFMEKPLVLKAMSQQVIHKTEKKLIELGIETEPQLRAAFAGLAERTSDVEVDTFLLQEQKKGIELIVGAKQDPAFGPVIMFGFGGINAELLQDIAVRVCPVHEDDVRALIHETKTAGFFSPGGFRGRKVNEDVIVSMLLKTSKMLTQEDEILELDFNPVIADEREAWIADARIIVKD